MRESDLRARVAEWPGVAAGIKWEDDLVFTVAGKMFCVLCVHLAKAGTLSCKVENHRFLELSGRPGFIPAPYLARACWVQVTDPARIPEDELLALLRRSYELVCARLPKKTRRDLAD